MVEAIDAMIHVREENKSLFIIVDEVSQYVHQDESRMLKLQSFVSELGQRLKGRVWLFATGQQKLEDTAGAIATLEGLVKARPGRTEAVVELGDLYRREKRFADAVTAVVGSWRFIIVQSVLLALWITLNVVAWMQHWDPYPFILLNLGLSFQAAYASPIIMMSQNRQARLSERRNHLDLQINMLAEQESTQMLHLLRKIAERLEVDCSDIPQLSALEETIDPKKLVQLIEKTVEDKIEK